MKAVFVSLISVLGLLPVAGHAHTLGLRFSLPGEVYDVPPRQVREAQPVMDANNRPALSLAFQLAATEWLAAATTQAVGESMVVSVCGYYVSAPVIREPISNGRFILTGNFTVEEVTALAEQIRSPSTCPH